MESYCIRIWLRDEDSTFVLAHTTSFHTNYSVNVGEALGFFNTLQWLADMQFDSVNFVIDSKITVDAFNSNRHDVTEFSHIITNSFPHTLQTLDGI